MSFYSRTQTAPGVRRRRPLAGSEVYRPQMDAEAVGASQRAGRPAGPRANGWTCDLAHADESDSLERGRGECVPYFDQHPLEGYRRLTFMMLDDDIARPRVISDNASSACDHVPPLAGGN